MITRLLKSTAFRFTLLYVAVFAASAAAVLLFTYQATIQDIEGQIKNVVSGQMGKIKQDFAEGGQEAAIRTINEMISEDIDRMSFFMLIDPDWKVVAGNVRTWPGGAAGKERWITFIPKVETEHGTQWVPALARTITLPDNHLLMVGYNLWHLERLREVITRVLTFTTILVVGIGILGGLTLTIIVKKRVEVLNKACRKVMSGRLDERVPLTGSGDEFDLLAGNFNAMMARIAELVDGMRTVSHNIAHDLRTPLNRVRNRLEGLIVTKPEPAKCFEQLRAVTKDIDGLVATFNAILSISEAEQGAGTEFFAEFDISQVITDVCDFYSLMAEENLVTMEYKIDPGLKLHGNRHLISQAAANLLDNAIKYTPEHGKITASLVKNGDNFLFSVCDSGPGIPEEYREKVKQRFFRMEKSRSTKGSGLGLSLVNAVVKLHGGNLTLTEGSEHSGVKAEIKIPAAT